MAGDWLMMRLDLGLDPRVVRLAALCGISRQHAVGCLHAVWSWFDRYTVDGNAECNTPGVTPALLDELAGVTGFANAMLDPTVQWLVRHPESDNLSIPDFGRWMSQSAKARAFTAQRVARHRQKCNADGNAECNTQGVTKTLPEKRREEYKNQPPNPLPPAEGGTACASPGDNGQGRDRLARRREERAERERRQKARVLRELAALRLPSDAERREALGLRPLTPEEEAQRALL